MMYVDREASFGPPAILAFPSIGHRSFPELSRANGESIPRPTAGVR